MKIGYFGFNNGPLGQPDSIVSLLKCAEDAGFESAWTGEHVVVIDPQEPPSPVPPEFPMLDTVATLAFSAAVTSKLKLGSGIILLAQRNPVVLAKELASIDVLSKGRLLFGVGVGYVKREFDVIGVPYEERGARTSEHIEAIRALWTQDKPVFDGRFTQISGVQSKPMPVQSPHPPIIIGGMSPAGYRRAIAHGDGWYGFNQTEDDAAASIEGLREAARNADKAARFDELEISITPRGAIDADRVKRYEDLGVSRLILLPRPASDADSPLDGVHRFIEDIGQQLDLA
ncbi:MAG: LLM class F420-dependent oxidoreductase [Gammaproteobacteria bacterium]|nr:LLM class F420-dependent oxidoreductase [Gammaproteobacteria bacterium]